MPIIMKKIYSISGNYTPEELDKLKGYIEMFRIRMADDDPDKNILIGKVSAYSDNKIIALLKTAMSDLNSGYPRTAYTLFNFEVLINNDLLLDGAMVFALVAEGILQLRNQIDYSDSGLTIAMFNKTSLYQGWAGFLAQEYMRGKMEVKAAVLPSSPNSGFVGIGSEFGYRTWW